MSTRMSRGCLKKYLLVEMLPAHVQESGIQVTDVRIDSILDRLSLNPNFESVLRLDVIGDGILIQTVGEVPEQHAAAVQCPD